EKSRLKLAAEEKMKKADNIINSSAKSKKKTKEKPNRMFETKSKGTSQKAMQRAAKALEQRVEQLEAVEAPQSENIIRFNKPKSLQLNTNLPMIAMRLTAAAVHILLSDVAEFQFPLGPTIPITGDIMAGRTTLLSHISQGGEWLPMSPMSI